MYQLKLTGRISVGYGEDNLAPVSIVLDRKFESREDAQRVVARLEKAFPSSSLTREIVEEPRLAA